MQQAASSSNTGAVTPSASRRPPRRTLWFMLLLMLLVLTGVAGVSSLALNSAAETIQSDLSRNLTAQAQTKVSQLTVWYGALRDQAVRLAASDPVRLFASEVDENKYDPAELLRMSRTEAEDGGMASLADVGQLNGLTQLGLQSPLMRRQLTNFVRSHSSAGGTLFNTRGLPYLTTESATPEYPDSVMTAVLDVMRTGKLQTLPVRRTAGGNLLMDVILPVFAPLYVDDSGKKIVGCLLLSIDVTARVSNFTRLAKPDDTSPESGRILQRVGKFMQELPADGSEPRVLADWAAPATGSPLELDKRTMLDAAGTQGIVYSLALPVPDTPLFVEQEIPVTSADEQYVAFRKSVFLSATLVTLVAALLLIMLWWWLVGRRERAVAAEMRSLYDTVTHQNRIIEGVNTSMEDGIVLSDDEGRFIYANQSFAAMAGETPATLPALTCVSLTNQSVAGNIRAHTDAVRRANTPLTFMDSLNIGGTAHNYQVACAPYRDERGAMLGVVSVYRDITDLLNAQEKTQHMVNQTVHVFVRAIETVDPYLRGQSAWTGLLATALARHMGLERHEATLRTAANLCQIGMIQLPHRLLAKTGKLTPEERSQMEKHVEYARNVLEGIDFGYPVLEAITQMYERLDGSGYPDHLTGDSIGIDGRILGVAGSFCALLRPRSYRGEVSQSSALDILDTTPPKYAPEVVQALRSYLQSPEGEEFLQELVKKD